MKCVKKTGSHISYIHIPNHLRKKDQQHNEQKYKKKARKGKQKHAGVRNYIADSSKGLACAQFKTNKQTNNPELIAYGMNTINLVIGQKQTLKAKAWKFSVGNSNENPINYRNLATPRFWPIKPPQRREIS